MKKKKTDSRLLAHSGENNSQHEEHKSLSLHVRECCNCQRFGRTFTDRSLLVFSWVLSAEIHLCTEAIKLQKVPIKGLQALSILILCDQLVFY